MNVTFTGPRPQHMGNCFRWKDKKRISIRKHIKKQIINLIINNNDINEFTFYIGMALGIDQDAFAVLLEIKDEFKDKKNIKLIATVPFRNQPNSWKESDKARYFTFLNKADDVIYVDELKDTKYYNDKPNDKEVVKEKLKTRNRYNVDKCDILYAYPVCNRNTSKGTLHCINYARKNNKQIVYTEIYVKEGRNNNGK